MNTDEKNIFKFLIYLITFTYYKCVYLHVKSI